MPSGSGKKDQVLYYITEDLRPFAATQLHDLRPCSARTMTSLWLTWLAAARGPKRVQVFCDYVCDLLPFVDSRGRQRPFGLPGRAPETAGALKRRTLGLDLSVAFDKPL